MAAVPEKYFYAVGRRKTSVATVRLYKSKGESTINGKPLSERLVTKITQSKFEVPFKAAGLNTADFYVTVKVQGGGSSAQLQAIQHGTSRALVVLNEEFKPLLKKAGLLTRDPREVERKKPGLLKARKSEQFSKR